jgi:hypothetical protein
MQYRIKEVVEDGRSRFYPQWKKGWFWRRFVWWSGEDGTIPRTVIYGDIKDALKEIEEDKEWRKIKPQPRTTIYHTV